VIEDMPTWRVRNRNYGIAYRGQLVFGRLQRWLLRLVCRTERVVRPGVRLISIWQPIT